MTNSVSRARLLRSVGKGAAVGIWATTGKVLATRHCACASSQWVTPVSSSSTKWRPVRSNACARRVRPSAQVMGVMALRAGSISNTWPGAASPMKRTSFGWPAMVPMRTPAGSAGGLAILLAVKALPFCWMTSTPSEQPNAL